jgi:hypothetical protein
MKEQDTHPDEAYSDISSLAQRAGIAFPTKASASLLKLFSSDSETADDEGRWAIHDVLWAARSTLSGNLSCRRYREGDREVFRFDFFCLVSGESEPIEVLLEVILDQKDSAGTSVWLRLAKQC